jgi:ribosomal protein S18 acetylase RimI-like enzyme
VKEKAMQKLKEVKAKTEDSGSKARQYLDGLLKIPFCIYRREPILNLMNEMKTDFVSLMKNQGDNIYKEVYSSLEISNYLKTYKCQEHNYKYVLEMLQNKSKSELTTYILKLNELIVKFLKIKKLKHSNKSRTDLILIIETFLKDKDVKSNIYLEKELKELFVRHEYRGKGVGRLLMQRVLEEAKRIGCYRVDLNVRDWNIKGINFYKKLGAKFVQDRLSMRIELDS